MTEEHGLGCYIKFIGKEYEMMKEYHLKKYNLTSQQINILMYLARHEKELINQKTLENVFSLSNATISGILKRLEQKKYIYRTFISNNKEKYIFLNQKGLDIKPDILNGVKVIEEILLKDFSQIEKENLLEYFKRINKNIKEVNHD